MHRVVFFGMNGAFSAVALHALAVSGLAPVLVVRGLPRARAERHPTTEVTRARRPLLTRLATRIRGDRPDEGAPRDLVASEARTELAPAEDIGIGEDLRARATARGIDVVTTNDANTLRARAEIAARSPDVFVVAGFPHLLSRDVLRLASRGGVNLHPGRLPAERGPSPLFWALKEGRTRLAFTVHVLDEGEDSGDVVSTGEIEFPPGLDGELVLARCARAAAPQLIRAVRGMLAGELVRFPQPREGAGRCPRPEHRDGRIDVTKSARAVFTFAGGAARVHSVFAECGGDRFYIARAISFDEQARMPVEYMLTGDRLLLGCNPGVVELELRENGALFTAEYPDEH